MPAAGFSCCDKRIAIASVLAPLLFATGCGPDGRAGIADSRTAETAQARPATTRDRADARKSLVNVLETKGIRNRRVLDAVGRVARHEFVPAEVSALAYEDTPLPIGYRQTISQPYIVAFMTDALEVENGARVLEIGTGSGYQAAVLAEMGADVYTIEIVAPLAERARADLERLGYDRVHVKAGDGYAGWPEHAPFDRILLTAVAPHAPDPLLRQLGAGGVLVMPVEDPEDFRQWLQILRKSEDGTISAERTLAVRFVPMTGRIREGSAER